jgi:hypothetical protein
VNTIHKHKAMEATGEGDGGGARLHSRKRSSRPIDKKVSRHATTRRIYFAVAALWGFILGSGFLAVALSADGNAIPKDLKTLGMVVGGAILSMIGGLVTAKAYRETMAR